MLELFPKEQYLAATREWHDADAALAAAKAGTNDAAIVVAKTRLAKADLRRALVERFADQVSDEEVAAITGTGVWGKTTVATPPPRMADLLRALARPEPPK